MKDNIEIREMQSHDEDRVYKLVRNTIFIGIARRVFLDEIMSKRFMFMNGLMSIVLAHAAHLSFTTWLLIFAMLPLIVYTCFPRLSFWLSILDGKAMDLNKLKTTMYNYWIRPDQPNRALWVATLDSKIVGTVAIRPGSIAPMLRSANAKRSVSSDKYTAVLERMAIVNEYQGLGIGKKLMNHAIESCKAQDYDEAST